MNIVVIGCTNGFTPDVPDGDILVCTGDFSSFAGSQSDAERFNAWLGTLPHRHKIVVPGDRDGYCAYSERLAKELFTNATLLIDEEVVVAGLRIYGTPWSPAATARVEATVGAFSVSDQHLEMKFGYIPEGIDILITHCPADNPVLASALTRVNTKLHVFSHGLGFYKRNLHDVTLYNAADDLVGAALSVTM